MASPTLAAEGSQAAVSSGDLLIVLPAHQANDIFLISITAYVPNTSGDADEMITISGWNLITQIAAPLAAEVNGRAAWFWKRAASAAEANPTFIRGGNWDTGADTVFSGRAYIIRGTLSEGVPYEAFSSVANYSGANGAFGAVTVSGTERLVVQFMTSQDDQPAGAAPGTWTAGTGAEFDGGASAGAGFQTFRKENVSSSTGTDASNVSAPAQGVYNFLGISFLPAIGNVYFFTG